MLSCVYCEIFKNNYFQEHPRTAASRVRINQKLNLRKQVVCKTDFQGVSFLMLKIMHVLHKLILSTSKMDEGAKQDVNRWKETVLFLLIIVLQEGN